MGAHLGEELLGGLMALGGCARKVCDPTLGVQREWPEHGVGVIREGCRVAVLN